MSMQYSKPMVVGRINQTLKLYMAREEIQYPIKTQHSQYHFFALLICRYDRVELLSPNIGGSFLVGYLVLEHQKGAHTIRQHMRRYGWLERLVLVHVLLCVVTCTTLSHASPLFGLL